MARLSAHGAEVGRIDFAHHRKAYMADGKVLKDTGHGWKVHGKVKPGFTPESAFAIARENLAAFRAANPAFAAYSDHLQSLAPLSKRWKLLIALRMMPGDPDGIWSECCDGWQGDIDADLDDIVKLCQLRETATREAQARDGAAARVD